MPEILIPHVWEYELEENPHHPNSGDRRLRVHCAETGCVSDGYHTFDDLYRHRCLLFCAFLKYHKEGAYKSKLHHDGLSWLGWFVAGAELNGKTISYHLPIDLWELCPAPEIDRAPVWDGHTSEDVCDRLAHFIGC